jgi:uncharacterized membrane protein
MPSVLAHHVWPPTGQPERAFGREVVLSSAPGAPRVWQWLLRRNCSITPRQLGQFYVSLCAVSLLISMFFVVQGAPLVLFFAGLELLAVGVALLVFARHAADRETLTLIGNSLQVEQHLGKHVQRAEFASDWVTVEPAAGQGSLVKLSSRGRSLHVGRFVRPELRAAFAHELRQVLRAGRPAFAQAAEHALDAPAQSQTFNRSEPK